MGVLRREFSLQLFEIDPLVAGNQLACSSFAILRCSGLFYELVRVAEGRAGQLRDIRRNRWEGQGCWR